MFNCGCGCNRLIELNDTLTCSLCKLNFFYECANFDQVNFKKLSKNRRKKWKCVNCRINSSVIAVKDMAPEISEDIIKEVKKLFTSEFEKFRKEIKSDMKNTYDKISELQSSVEFFSSKIDDFNITLDSLVTKNKELALQNDIFKTKINYLENQVVELEQYTRKNNLVLTGIPVTKNENIYEVVKQVADALDVNNYENDINIVHRLPNSDKTSEDKYKTPAILISFTNRRTKEIWVSKYKKIVNDRKANSSKTVKYVHPFRTTMINKNLTDNPVYFSDHLSNYYKKLLYETKNFAKQNNIAYVWVKNGSIWLRKSAETRAERVQSLDYLEKMKTKYASEIYSGNADSY